MQHYQGREGGEGEYPAKDTQRGNLPKPESDPRSESVKVLRDSLSSPSSVGYESPSQLNREVTSILSKGNPPKTAMSQFTHPELGSSVSHPQDMTSRSNSCPLYQNTKLWGSGSPYQPSDQSVELRNHLYQAALHQNSSPFTPPLRYPFLPPNKGFFPSFPPGMNLSPLRQQFQPPFPSMSPFYQPGTRASLREATLVTQAKRRQTDDNYQLQLQPHLPPTHPTQERQSIVDPSTTSTPSSTHPPAVVIPPYFKKGSVIQLASGEMKKVEDLETEDFLESAKLCHDLSIDHATVVRLEPVQSTGLFLLSFSVGKGGAEARISASPEHPFFVHGRGWSSCSPSLSMARYSLSTHQLAVGDTCISLTQHIDSSSESALMPPPHTSPETAKDYKQVRFQDSPTPKKRKYSQDISTTQSETTAPVLVKVRVAQSWESPHEVREQGGRFSPLPDVLIGDKKG